MYNKGYENRDALKKNDNIFYLNNMPDIVKWIVDRMHMRELQGTAQYLLTEVAADYDRLMEKFWGVTQIIIEASKYHLLPKGKEIPLSRMSSEDVWNFNRQIVILFEKYNLTAVIEYSNDLRVRRIVFYKIEDGEVILDLRVLFSDRGGFGDIKNKFCTLDGKDLFGAQVEWKDHEDMIIQIDRLFYYFLKEVFNVKERGKKQMYE